MGRWSRVLRVAAVGRWSRVLRAAVVGSVVNVLNCCFVLQWTKELRKWFTA